MVIALAGVRVLIVDDDPAVRSVLEQVLRFWGCESVETAVNGKEGVEKYPEFLPHLVLMDVEMPAMNGYDASRTIREQDPGAAIILLTGLPDGEMARKTLERGFAKVVIPKPFRFEQLKMAIHEVLKGKEAPSHGSQKSREAVA